MSSDHAASAAASYGRRRFLRRTAYGAAALTAGAFLPMGCGSPDEIPPGIAGRLKFASPREFLVLRAAAVRLAGPDAVPAGTLSADELALRADAFLAGADEEVQDQFHQLLTVFNGAVFAFLFDLRFSSFLGMSPEDQDSYLEDWMTSPIGFRRTAFQGLKRVCLSVLYTSPASWDGIGFDGNCAA